MILSDKYKVINVNIEECYSLWYHNNYQGKFESYEEDLVLLCASLMVKEEKEFKEILQMIKMKPEIMELMEGKIREMNHDEKLVTEYRTWKDENERINASIIKEERKKAHQEGLEEGILKGLEKGIKQGIEQGIEQGIAKGSKNTKKEIVLEMYKEKVDVELIKKYTNLSQQEIEKFIKIN